MTTAKISFKLGKIEFTGEGAEEWLAVQLDKVLESAVKQSNGAPDAGAEDVEEATDDGNGPPGDGAIGTLASFLKEKKAGSNQNRRFLATAAWLAKKKKSKTPTPGDVQKALKENHQGRLGNPSETLNQNVGKGFCEKEGGTFYVTPEGFEELDK